VKSPESIVPFAAYAQVMVPDPLFDADDYVAQAAKSEDMAPAALPEDALVLDRNTALVPGDDGLLARKVSVHSLDKAHHVHYYADIVGRAMKKAYGGPLVWVELFAGPGRLYVKEMDAFKPGSPVEAVDIKVPFDTYVFVDLDERCVSALQQRVGSRPGVHVLQGDANAADIHDRILELVPRNALFVLYADPEGLDLHFETLRFFAERYKHLDLLLNFPVPGIDRALSAGHEAKASLVLNHPSPVELIGPGSGRPGTSVREYFERQLGGLGYSEFATQPIKLDGKNVPLYDILLASREPKAKQFFEESQKRGPGGQYAMTFDC
jgi:three-Cys-motif partner protein